MGFSVLLLSSVGSTLELGARVEDDHLMGQVGLGASPKHSTGILLLVAARRE